jgi:hypothetical protein
VLEAIALLVLVVWGLGIVLQAIGVAVVFKNPEHEAHDKLHGMIDQVGPAVVVSLLTLLVVFWPATLVFSTVTKNRK